MTSNTSMSSRSTVYSETSQPESHHTHTTKSDKFDDPDIAKCSDFEDLRKPKSYDKSSQSSSVDQRAEGSIFSEADWPEEDDRSRRKTKGEEMRGRLLSFIRSLRVTGEDGVEDVTSSFDYKTCNEDPLTGECRRQWVGRFDFTLACVSHMVGEGNAIHFPLMVLRHGGSAVLLPYVLFNLTFGYALVLMEMALGQFCSRGMSACWKFAPLFSGMWLPYAYVIVIAVITTAHKNVLQLRSIINLVTGDRHQHHDDGDHVFNHNASGCGEVSLHFLQDNGPEELGDAMFYWDDIFFCVLFYLSLVPPLVMGMNVLGKVLAFFAIMPFLLLLMCFIKTMSLSGAADGIARHFRADFQKLGDSSAWIDAGKTMFNSLSLSHGVLITLSSFNHFHNNLVATAFFSCLLDLLIGLCSAFVMFALLGHTNVLCGADMVESIISIDDALIGQVAAFSLVSNPNFWIFVLLINLIFLKYGILILDLEILVTMVTDGFVLRYRWRRLVIPVVCVALSLLSMLLYTAYGEKVTAIITHSYGLILSLIGCLQVISIAWMYGVDQFIAEIEFMVGWDVSLLLSSNLKMFLMISLKYIGPLGTLTLLCISLEQVELHLVEDVVFNFLPFAMVLVMVSYMFLSSSSGSFSQRLRQLTTPTKEWGPALPQHRRLVKNFRLCRISLESEKKRYQRKMSEDSFRVIYDFSR